MDLSIMEQQIIYVGCGVAGRSTSLTHVIQTTGAPVIRYANGEYHFTYRQYHVVAIISTFRGWLYYENPLDPTLHEQIVYEIDRLCTCDGIVFVIDSWSPHKPRNLRAFERLKGDLASRGIDVHTKPIVFQVNKRDLEDICSIDWVRENFRTQRCDYVESIATQGIGTREALDKLFDLMLTK